MRTASTLLLFTLVCHISILPHFTHYMQERPFLQKIGYTLQPAIIKFAATDQKDLTAVLLILKVVFHSGHLLQLNPSHHSQLAEQENTFTLLKTASRLDPYNMDGYYLAQAMAWDKRNIPEITELLEYGMQYRDWDFYLPFFAGFNYGYFLKDYPKAAKYYKLAQKITHSPLFGRLAGRYLYEGGETDMAVVYLDTMVKNTKNKSVRESYQLRLQALQEVQRIEDAVQKYITQEGTSPSDINTLIFGGYLSAPLVDPYGGTFYLDKNKKPRSTSKFSFVPNNE
ncbi:hypothetical protein [Desulfocapsa sulfexigens]|uniref:hypothetical protein n=1 Tax=Desulfocapsa sulfexigens TaxID=65555 RepID=UPI0012946B0D|nr:hypothetical protein [Desulfocapsa sulfexigens]